MGYSKVYSKVGNWKDVYFGFWSSSLQCVFIVLMCW